jgi:hypothetical protein
MGTKFFDQYSLLHFASGIIAYFFGIKWIYWIIIHTIFEYSENTAVGMEFINSYLPFWPGGKPNPDAITNSIGDSISATFGWSVAYTADRLGVKFSLYPSHLTGNRIF